MQKVSKILVVRFSSIGDIVLTTPIPRCLKNQLDNVEIHYLTKKTYVSLLQGNPNIDKIYSIEKDIDEVIGELKREKYDHIVDLHKNLRTKRLIGKLGVKSSTFSKLNFQKFMLTRFKVNRMPDVHIVDRYFEAVNAFGVKNDQKGLQLELAHTDTVEGLPEKFMVIAAGAKFATKRMPFDLISKVLSNISTQILVLGGDEDKEIGQRLEERFSHVKSYCGKLSLRKSAFVISKASAALTSDTGLMHIGSAFKIPLVTVWGNTTSNLGMYPYIPENKDLYTLHELELSCRPCSKIGYNECPKKHFNCMNKQDADRIAKDLMRYLNE